MHLRVQTIGGKCSRERQVILQAVSGSSEVLCVCCVAEEVERGASWSVYVLLCEKTTQSTDPVALFYVKLHSVWVWDD